MGQNSLMSISEAPLAPQEAPLHRAALACLREVDNLVDTWFTYLRDIPSYREGLVSPEIVRQECALVFTRLLSDIGGLTMPSEARSISGRVGHSRAFRGVPLSDLLTAIRLDYRVLWDALLTHLGPSDMEAIKVGVPRLLDAVERHSQETTKAYNLTQYGMMQSRQDECRLWLTRLFETDGKNQVLNLRACEVLSFDTHRPFIVFTHTRSSDASLEVLLPELRRRRVVAHHYAIEVGEILVTQLPEAEHLSVNAWLEASSISVASIGPFPGLSTIPTAIRLLLTLTEHLPTYSKGVICLEDHWPLATVCSPNAAGTLLRHMYLREIEKLPSQERILVSQTAEAYLSTGSVSETSKILFCHRNTTSNRLDQIADLTGLDLRRPRDASVYLLAIASGQQFHTQPTVL